jgi:alpha-N-arabinofuranosidase
MYKRLLLNTCLSLFLAHAIAQPSANLTVRAGNAGIPIQPTMWGIFFEDINMAADGGLYAEMVKNRSFEFNAPMMGWKEHKEHPADGSVLVLNRGAENPANPRFIRLTHYSGGAYGLSNEGFRGMGVKKDEQYHFSIWARPQSVAPLTLRLELITPGGQKIATARLPLASGSTVAASNPTAPPAGATQPWQQAAISLTATATESHAQLYLWIEGQGSVDLDMISLFPQHTWKERPGGLRADLVQLLADMHPGFIRFPGGCIVEGRELATRYQWKKTVGKVEDRQLIVNRWNTEFAHRLTPDYYQSFGLGFFEYFQLAEDIGAEPLPILNCGMACQFNTSEVVPVDELQPYIQDALDLIEFANGAVTTRWGGLRAAMGHPAPFNLKMMGVGNEQWGPQYVERYTIFTKAIKDKYPGIRLVNSVGPNPDGEMFDFLNDTLRKLHADILDEHYYRAPEWFLKNAGRYDHYDRNGPKIFAGEYAAQSAQVATPDNKNNWKCALSEAAYMTGLERNADVVQMASYAPLFAHVDGWQWTPDLIWFDNLRSYGTPDYYVQKLFSTNKGSVAVPLTRDQPAGTDHSSASAPRPLTGQDGLYGSACIDKETHELILKLVNTTSKELNPVIRLEGVKKAAATASVAILKAGQLESVNSLDDPAAVSPVLTEMPCKDKKLNPVMSPYSFVVIRLKMQ